MLFNEDEVVNLFNHRYGQAYTYSVLALLYPTLDFRNRFHQDHIFPKSLFTPKRLKDRGIDSSKIEFYMSNCNCLANLQLLEGIPNQEKSSKDFKQWLLENYPEELDRKDYMNRHYIPNVDLSLANFQEFIMERTKLMAKAFEQLVSRWSL